MLLWWPLVCVFNSQGLYSSKWSKSAFGQGLDLVVVQWQQRKVLQVLEGTGTNAVNLIGIQQPERKDKGKGWRKAEVKRERENQIVGFSLCFISLYIPSRKLHRYRVYFKVITPSLSGSKRCLHGVQCMSVLDQHSVCMQEFSLQQLQGIEAVKHSLGEVGDLISI